MTLTRTQQAVLDRMKAGAKLHHLTGLHAHWWLDTKPHIGVRHATVVALQKAGVLTMVKDDWRGSTWVAK